MNVIGRNLARLSNQVSQGTSKQYVTNHIRNFGFIQNKCSVRPLTRSMVVLSSPSKFNSHKSGPSTLCSCGCGIHGMHTKGDRELIEFLQEEIVSEKKIQFGALPTHVNEFTIKQEKAELIFTRKFNDEIIDVSLNVNHTVNSDEMSEGQAIEGEAASELKSQPDFEVDIKVGDKVLSFTCQFTPTTDISEGDHAEDVFGITELTMYEGEWEEKTYCVSGDILDGNMYDLLMNILDERGIGNEFVEKLSDLCTKYEHGLYIGFLEQIHNFVKRK